MPESPVQFPPTPAAGQFEVEEWQTGLDSEGVTTNHRPQRNFSVYKKAGEGLESTAVVTEDGRIQISLDLKNQEIQHLSDDHAVKVKEYAVDRTGFATAPPLNVVIMIVGSRGDVQPYVALALRLKQYGHRVRIATHETFRKFVRDYGLEFFAIGGDPAELMSYMVRNPGLIPGFESLTNGDISKKRKMIKQVLNGCWRSCYEADDMTGQTFAADAIISNPPTFAHVHCAEALGIPLHLSFTMPWCATTAFPHPLANIQQSNTDKTLTNYLSFALADNLQWHGLGDVINNFRVKALGLEPLSLRSGPSVTDRLKIPWTYCFSPTLIPKPEDWMNHIDVVGFYFIDPNESYKPPEDLAKFLAEGDPPVYIGFGSVVVQDAEAMTRKIFQAIRLAGVRAIVSAGWGGLGGSDIPPGVFILPSHPGVPHDWLFKHVSAVCHHGGAGTTAIGVYLGKPTIVVPFFGDQPFWGAMIHSAGAGPAPIQQKKLTAEKLAAGIAYCLTPQAKQSAQAMGARIRAENGTTKGVDSFHAHLPLLNMRCDLDPSRAAVWWTGRHLLKLSPFAAQVLADAGHIDIDTLECHRPREYDTRAENSNPVSGGVGGLFWTLTETTTGLAQILTKPKEGAINVGTALPRGASKILFSVQEGLYNVPKMLGSEIRQQGEITNWKTGFVEGGKAFGYGCYDGITSIVIEPYRGGKKEGPLGVAKGLGRSLVNMHAQTAAGGLALFTHPAKGLWASARKRWVTTRKQNQQFRSARQDDGVKAVKESTPEMRDAILEEFKKSLATREERREKLSKDLAGRAWKRIDTGMSGDSAARSSSEKENAGSGTTSPKNTSTPSIGDSRGSGGLSISGRIPLGSGRDLPPELAPRGHSSPATPLRSPQADVELLDGEGLSDLDEAAFQRDLARALELSLIENDPPQWECHDVSI